MKAFLILVAVLGCAPIFAQNDSDYQIDSLKSILRKYNPIAGEEIEASDLDTIIYYLNKAVTTDSLNAENRYFLGEAYKLKNHKDGTGITSKNIRYLIKASEQFEKVIEISPKYEGKIIKTDPYSKITSEWGAMALNLHINQKTDSAIWAFKEGKKRGGFSNYILELQKKTLENCSKNSILFSSGDNNTLLFYYLQLVEKIRPDVTLVDINLIYSTFYPIFLIDIENIDFNFSKEEINSVEYIPWSDSLVTINDFSWTVKPTYSENYLLRGDRLLLNLISKNGFRKDLYFTTGIDQSSIISLGDHLSKQIVADQLIPSGVEELPFHIFKKNIEDLLMLTSHINKNSKDDRWFLYNLRLITFNYADGIIDKKNVIALLDLLIKYAPIENYPYLNPVMAEYEQHLRGK